jgi:metallo-beta-lactamase family protein
MQLTFLGAAGTVTGSRYLLSANGRRVLIDCGLFQGYKQLRLRNWAPTQFEPKEIDATVLTHAHIDHSGYIPLLVKRGFQGKVFSTPATFELCRILLPDSGFLQEEEARFANRHGYSKHRPAMPLYTQQDAQASLERFETRRVRESFTPAPGVKAVFHRAGHLLGAAGVQLTHGGATILFSGDLGRANDPLMNPPDPPPASDYVVLESTYGDRQHPVGDVEAELGPIIRSACIRGATILMPAFAVGRAQLLLLLIARLKAKGAIPDVPVYLDSPMAIDVTQLYRVFTAEHRLSWDEIAAMGRVARLVHTVEESKAIDQRAGPQIIISASGMATGGRVVHHLKTFAPDPKNLILLAGFQAGGTRGAALAAGTRSVRIHGQDVSVNAHVLQLSSMSAHADADELLAWIKQLPRAPKQTFITHGEPAASDALRARIERELGWRVTAPEHRETMQLERG